MKLKNFHIFVSVVHSYQYKVCPIEQPTTQSLSCFLKNVNHIKIKRASYLQALKIDLFLNFQESVRFMGKILSAKCSVFLLNFRKVDFL